MRTIILSVVACIAALCFCAAPVHAQNASEDAAIMAAVDTVRADLKSEKKEIVTETMQLSEADAKKFWPVYQKYQEEVDKLMDERITILKQYVDKYWTVNDTDAIALTKQVLTWQSKRNDLRKKYLDLFVKSTSGVTAAKFFQVEHRLDLLLDLKVAAGVPGLFMKADLPKSSGEEAKK